VSHKGTTGVDEHLTKKQRSICQQNESHHYIYKYYLLCHSNGSN